jgi:hypothetical protein
VLGKSAKLGDTIVGVESILFVDANQYLNLYRMVSGKNLLAALEEQREYIFVTAQVVDEVHRQKVKVAASFLAEQIRKLEPKSIAVPDHLLGTGDGRVVSMREQLREINKRLKDSNEELRKLTRDLLEQVSQSKDEVSKRLAAIFSRAVAPKEDELQRARVRRERGNPPGKRSDPLGDQLNWEQILSQCQGNRRVWIITKDSDYATEHDGTMFLNAALYQELARLYRSVPEVFCFDNIVDGFRHFAATNGVKAEKLPTSEETEQIKKEQESLPPLGWLENYDEANSIAIQKIYRERESALRAALRQVASEDVFPPQVSEAD